MRELKLPLIFAVFVGVIVIGLGARSLYYHSQVVTPMEAVATNLPGVISLELVAGSKGAKNVIVTLDSSVELEKVYQSVDELAQATLGRNYGDLIVKDRRTPDLAQAFYSIHFLIQEGISTGLFAAMADGIEQRLGGVDGVHHRIFVDDHHVFVQLYDDENYLYEVVPRSYGGMTALGGQTRGGRLLW